MFVLTRVPLKVLEKTLKSKPPNFSHRATMVLPRLRSMQTFSKFALIYESINQLVRYFMGSFVILFLFFSLFFAYYWLTFVFRLVVCCLFLSVLQIFSRISFCCTGARNTLFYFVIIILFKTLTALIWKKKPTRFYALTKMTLVVLFYHLLSFSLDEYFV